MYPVLRSSARRPIRRIAGLLTGVAISLGLAACADRRGGEIAVYEDVGGEIVALAPERRQVTIAHDAIPGFMDAMTMPFDVEDPGLLAGLAPGDRVRFTLRGIDGRYAIRAIQRVAGAAPRGSPAAGPGLLGGTP